MHSLERYYYAEPYFVGLRHRHRAYRISLRGRSSFPAPPPVYVPPAPVFTWTGVYVGGQIGYGWGKDDATISDGGFANGFTPPPPAPPATAGDVGPARPAAVADPAIPFIPYSYSDFNRINNNASGVIGGAHVGYNYQINQFVLGLEGDVDGSSLSKTANFAPFSNYYQDYIPISIHSNLGVQGSIRGRLGYAFDRVLVYATAAFRLRRLQHQRFDRVHQRPVLPGLLRH